MQAILRTLGVPEGAPRGSTLSGQILERIEDRRLTETLLEALPTNSALVLRLFGLFHSLRLPASGVLFAANLLGIDADEAIQPLLEQGLVVILQGAGEALPTFDRLIREGAPLADCELRVHPAVIANSRPVLPDGEPPASLEEGAKVFGIRESDGLEPILRLAALWQARRRGRSDKRRRALCTNAIATG